MDLGLFVLRIVVGLLFAGHGAQKLFGWFGGHGLEGTAAFFESIGLKPGDRHARAAGLSEFGGGILLAVGLFTPIAAAALIAVMTAAVLVVHAPKGVWATDGGYEYNVVLGAAAFALAAVGAGAWSLDSAFSFHDHGVAWAILALAIGLAGGWGAVVSSREAPERAEGERREAPERAQGQRREAPERAQGQRGRPTPA